MPEGSRTPGGYRGEAQDLKAAWEDAEAAGRTSTEFLTGMAHALLTPLNAILGFSQILRQRYCGDLNEKQVECLEEIQANGEQVLRLITDVLDIARTDRRRTGLNVTPVCLRSFLAHCSRALKDACAKHDGRLVIETPGIPDEMEIKADPQKIRRVLYDLLTDAARQVPRGGTITLLVRPAGDRLVFSVDGTGAPASGAGRGPAGKREVKPGEGAAELRADLALARRIVEMHGGTLRAESPGPEGQGRYLFDLPLNASRPEPPGSGDDGPKTASARRATAEIEERALPEL